MLALASAAVAVVRMLGVGGVESAGVGFAVGFERIMLALKALGICVSCS